jgi:acetyl esterase/lipase
MKSLFALCVLLLTHCAIFVPSQQSVQSKDGYSITRDVIYTPSDWPEPVRGDLYRPRKSKTLAPAILLVHGGGWTGKDGRWQMNPIAKKLVKKGYVVLNVTYRLAPRWTYPAPVKDLQEAVKWMRAHAVEEGIDPNRIATFGYSAGGYLATKFKYSSNRRWWGTQQFHVLSGR